ncbi:MAG: cell division protein ZipA C-terminal FtsZ-binding domain-containing protein, partial [Gallionellaceae bacterium]|nr:cell division protein ZipA C-terminal FtsZ-binding domain-containing protein [Gallionellaceae bacterium]
GADGGFSLRDADGRLLFSLTDGTGGEEEPSHGITLLFDVPRVADGLAAFDRMAALGLDLAERLGGQLVDDGGRPASRASLARERQNLEAIYARMAARGIPAGGDRALRLFA